MKQVAIAPLVLISLLTLSSCSLVAQALTPTHKQIVGTWSNHETDAPFTATIEFHADGSFDYSDVPRSAIVDAYELQNTDPTHGQFTDIRRPVSGSGTWEIDPHGEYNGTADVDLTFSASKAIGTNQLGGMFYQRGSVFGGPQLIFEYGDPDDPLLYEFVPVK